VTTEHVTIDAHQTIIQPPIPCGHRVRLRNDLYCVEWGVKLYSLTASARDDVIDVEMSSHGYAAMTYDDVITTSECLL